MNLFDECIFNRLPTKIAYLSSYVGGKNSIIRRIHPEIYISKYTLGH